MSHPYHGLNKRRPRGSRDASSQFLVLVNGARRILRAVEGPETDPWINAQIDAAIAPYLGRLPADQIAWMRERLWEALTTEEHGQELVRRARPRVVENSGEVAAGSLARVEERARKNGVRR